MKWTQSDLPGLRAAGLIVAGLMVAPSAPLGWVEYIRTGDDAMLHVKRRRRRRGDRKGRGERRCLQSDVS